MDPRAAVRALGLAAMLLGGCGSRMIPGTIVEGTTATIAIPYDFDVGYGFAWTSNPNATQPMFQPSDLPVPEDLQRGELFFTLVDASNSQMQWKLPVRLITRVARDPASVWATGAGNHLQPIAVLDIPKGIVGDGEEKDFWIKVERKRRDPNAGFDYVGVPQSQWSSNGWDWWGWGSQDGGPGSRDQLIPVKVMDAPELDGLEAAVNRYTPIEAWGPYGNAIKKGFMIETELYFSTPLPEFRIQRPEGSTQPYAWEMKLDYPVERMVVSDVRLLRGRPSGGLVTWKAEPTPSCSDGQTVGTLDIHAVETEHATSAISQGVAVVFHLANQGDANCRTRISPGDVQIAYYRGYDISGNVLSGASPFQIVVRDLH